MFNYVVSDVKKELINPYYPYTKVEIPGSGRLCLEGPFPSNRISRCLTLTQEPADNTPDEPLRLRNSTRWIINNRKSDTFAIGQPVASQCAAVNEPICSGIAL